MSSGVRLSEIRYTKAINPVNQKKFFFHSCCLFALPDEDPVEVGSFIPDVLDSFCVLKATKVIASKQGQGQTILFFYFPLLTRGVARRQEERTNIVLSIPPDSLESQSFELLFPRTES